MRIIVTGASGYLAHRLVPIACETAEVIALSRSRPDDQTLSTATWEPTDLLDATATDALVARVQPDAIISAAAVNPGQGEGWAINIDGVENLAAAASRHDVRLVHVSTDIVHSGRRAPYSDDAEPDPVNDYGRSKAEGEAIITRIAPEAAIVRTSLIYGLDRMDRGTESFQTVIEQGDPLSLWHDAIRHPVWVDALATGLVRLAGEFGDERGTLNLAGGEALSRAEFGRMMLDHWGIDSSGVTEGSVNEHPTQAADLTLRHDRAHSLGLATPTVSEVLGA